ncbi:MAG: hypothetical protein LC799_33430 [Actinobacteria bacterium]|nr:hypothetical protein [Actinomycetota bacterium]
MTRRHRLSKAQLAAVADYVRRRRMDEGLTVVRAAAAADLSARKWYAVEAAVGNHNELTLRAIAAALKEESPSQLLALAGYEVEPAWRAPPETESASTDAASIANDVREVKAMLSELLARQAAERPDLPPPPMPPATPPGGGGSGRTRRPRPGSPGSSGKGNPGT